MAFLFYRIFHVYQTCNDQRKIESNFCWIFAAIIEQCIWVIFKLLFLHPQNFSFLPNDVMILLLVKMKLKKQFWRSKVQFVENSEGMNFHFGRKVIILRIFLETIVNASVGKEEIPNLLDWIDLIGKLKQRGITMLDCFLNFLISGVIVRILNKLCCLFHEILWLQWQHIITRLWVENVSYNWNQMHIVDICTFINEAR